MLCTTGTIGDETQLLFECPELQEGRDKWASLFSGPDTGQKSVWQEDPISVAGLITECLDKVMLSQLAHLMVARHLIGPMWLEAT